MESKVYTAQKPLRASYLKDPERAMVTDHALTGGESPSDPYHTTVEPMDGCGVAVPVGVHAALGGPHDAPTPGDILCSALASCQDSTLRMVANLLGIEITHLAVKVRAKVDVRGTLAMDPTVPVGFQAVTCDVRLGVKEGTPERLLRKLEAAAVQCCVVQQTFRAPPEVKTRFEVEQGG